jgi:hypothetical protein
MENNKQQTALEKILQKAKAMQKKRIGWYRLGTNKSYCSIAFATYKKPNFMKRFFMRTLLDFYWIKEEQQ